HRDSENIGLNSIRRSLPADATQEQVEAAVDELNEDPACTGYIVQLPLPPHIDTDAILERIDPAKDADGLHPLNLGRLVLNAYRPVRTPAAGRRDRRRRRLRPPGGSRRRQARRDRARCRRLPARGWRG